MAQAIMPIDYVQEPISELTPGQTGYSLLDCVVVDMSRQVWLKGNNMVRKNGNINDGFVQVSHLANGTWGVAIKPEPTRVFSMQNVNPVADNLLPVEVLQAA